MKRYEKYGEELSALGYDVTPLNGKVPILKGWQKRPEAAKDFAKHGDSNIGILTGGVHNIVAVDIDIKDQDTAVIIRNMAIEQLGFAPERIGNAPKTLLVYKCSEPFYKVKTAVYSINGEDACAVECLAEGQQFVASGKHPGTNKPYSYPDDSLLDIPPLALTEITPDEISNFIAMCNNALSGLGEIKAKSLSNGSKPPKSVNYEFAEGSKMADLAKIDAAICYVPNDDLHYDDWVYCAHGIKGSCGEEGLELFHRWSKRSSKYDATETDRLWNSIGEVKTIGAGTVFHMAQQHGYQMDVQDTAVVQEAAVAKVEKEYQELDQDELKATPFGDISAEKIPRRSFLYGTHLIEKYVSATIAQGGGSKTTVLLTDAVALVTNRKLIGNAPKYQCNAWHYNLEDPIDELQRRVIAICKKYSIPLSEIKDKLFLDSARTRKLIIAEKVGNVIVATPDVDAVIKEIIKHDIKSFSVDPFVKAHHADENDNKQIDAVLDQFARISNETGCAIDLAHHVRKPAVGQNTAHGDINQARGASAISGAVRAARTISIMTDKEAESVGVPIDMKNWYIRIDDAKGNMSPPASKASWLQRESIMLDNGDAFEPGDNVGVVANWTPPDAFDGISPERARELLTIIEKGLKDGVRYSKNKGKRWAGKVLVDEVMDMDETKAKIIIKTWLKSEVLLESEYVNADSRHNEKGLHVDYEKMPRSD